MSNVISKLKPKYIVLFLLLQVTLSSHAENIYIPSTLGAVYETPITPITLTGKVSSSGYMYSDKYSFGFTTEISYFCGAVLSSSTTTILSNGQLGLNSYSVNSDFYLIPNLYGTYSFFKPNEDTITTYSYEFKNNNIVVTDDNGNEVPTNKNNTHFCGIVFPTAGKQLKPNSQVSLTVQGTWILWRETMKSSAKKFDGSEMGKFFQALLLKDDEITPKKLSASESLLPFRNDTFRISNIDCNLVMPSSIDFGNVSIRNTDANQLIATESMPFSVSCQQDPNLTINSNIFISFSANSQYLDNEHPNRLLLKRSNDKPVSVVGEWSNNGVSKQPNCDNTITDSTILFNGRKSYSVGSLLSSEQNKTFDLSIDWGLCTQYNKSLSESYFSGYTTVNLLIK
ncbi:hypothetical protein [Proteus mirabilis]|uniref:hypothetical protein n=2 Tax=Proteus mirabilis TaxID=584 RepID=UPI000F89954B|nr:hypothetical protein [Proteus mirabilis]MBG2815089.1 hypothetical protein [Proteus mirabilis]MBG2865189.1 hypothetical protein [Proteus mirabilis]MBL1398395.1 hypothetical protein [Proteus mirabilis]MCL8566581.1 hypothetical protein [Proteus mirabilis]MDC9760309.1 hypothetical protein [Proteus mirabilis]